MTMTTATATARGARLFPSLDRRDRTLLLTCLGLVALMIGVVALLGPQEDDDNTVPSSYSSGSHGAEAAYLALERSGYHIERWERPLTELAAESDAHTVVIFAEPSFQYVGRARAPIAKILARGGRVLATGFAGAWLLPNNEAEGSPLAIQSECDAQPEGFGPLADSGVVHLRASVAWKMVLPEQRAQYRCGGNAVVVSYAAGPGRVVWWADSLPLENAAVARDGDLALLLHSLGPSADTRIVWDESLHGDEPGVWSYSQGTPVHLLWAQLGLVGVLLVLSFSRRSGPLLPDPAVARDAPLEFVYSLGALYDKAGATNTAVRIAYDRFRLLLGRQIGRGAADSTAEMVSVVHARLGRAVPKLEQEMLACDEVSRGLEPAPPREALALVQSLWTYEEEMKQGMKRERGREERSSGRTERTN